MYKYCCILQMVAKDKSDFGKLVDIFNGCRDLGMKIDYGTSLADAFLFLCNRMNWVKDKNTEFYYLEYLMGKRTSSKKIKIVYEVLQEVNGGE